MPEILTKFPDIVMSMLQKMGGVCGKGGPQEILKGCPAGSFCSVPGVGEFCVLGLNQANKLTQFSLKEGMRTPKTEVKINWWLVLLFVVIGIGLALLLWFLLTR